mmetsp:Transcript_6554/g.19364  ORF Transcript_6554/g.19364 Transcript_6554/m.19364 type:complete len:246 (-) Transcript_6554:1897-2634(-)
MNHASVGAGGDGLVVGGSARPARRLQAQVHGARVGRSRLIQGLHVLLYLFGQFGMLLELPLLPQRQQRQADKGEMQVLHHHEEIEEGVRNQPFHHSLGGRIVAEYQRQYQPKDAHVAEGHLSRIPVEFAQRLVLIENLSLEGRWIRSAGADLHRLLTVVGLPREIEVELSAQPKEEEEALLTELDAGPLEQSQFAPQGRTEGHTRRVVAQDVTQSASHGHVGYPPGQALLVHLEPHVDIVVEGLT